MKYFKRVSGKNIYLSPVNPDDYIIFTEWLNDPEVVKNLLLDTKIVSLVNEKDALENLARNGYHFAIVLNKGDELIGICSIENADFINRTGLVGIFIGNKQYWNKGLGQEALGLLTDYGFQTLNLNNIMLTVFSFNKRAIKCYEKAGFKQFGVRKEAKIVNEIKYDEIYMQVLRKDKKNL